MKIQNLFNIGIIDKDSQNRFVQEGKLIDAENFFVNSLESNSGGVGKNALGNALKTAYNIAGGKTIGHGVNTSNGKVYNLVKGNTHDYIIEYDSENPNSSLVRVAQSTTGTRLNFKTGERITNVEVLAGNTDADTLLKFSGDSNPPRILNIARAKTWAVDGFTAEEIMLIKAPPLYPPVIELVNTLDKSENFMSDKFISFAYRYKYKDNYYSAISSWQEYAFTPGKFDLDFATLENKGMENIYNACNITFNTGQREVSGVDLLFKKSNSDVVYVIDRFIKEDEDWGDSVTKTIQFNNSKVYGILPKDQYYRSYDNVPDSSVAATFAGNRAFYGNYIDGKPMIDSNDAKVLIDFTTDVVSVDLASTNITTTQIDSLSPAALVTPFATSTIAKGALSIDFTGSELKQGGILFLSFDLESVQSVSVKNVFTKTYTYILLKDYSTIQALVNDTPNGFKTGLESQFSTAFQEAAFNAPAGTILPYAYVGFTVSATSSNVIVVKLPTAQYVIDNTPDANTYVNDFFYNVSTVVTLDSSASKKSMKSYRSYEVCQIYRDLQGRKTTGLTSENNTVFIPIQNSVKQNKIQITIPALQKPPKWATTYKFGIKENKGKYEVIYSNIFYVDGIFRWIKIDGENKNKVKEGDVLLVKSDINNAITTVKKIKVLEIKLQDKDFILDNKDAKGQNIVEQAGLYMKIKPENLSLDYSADEFIVSEDNTATTNDFPVSYLGIGKLSEATPTANVFTDKPIRSGAILDIHLHANRHNDDSNRMNDFKRTFIANADYISFEAFYNAEIANVEFKGQDGEKLVFAKSLLKGYFTSSFTRQFVPSATGQSLIKITGTASGNGNWRGFLWASMNLRNVNGYVILETLGEETDNEIFYETPEVYTITAGQHQQSVHVLEKTFNCFSQGNGVESYQIKDAFNQNYLSIDCSPTGVSQDEYGATNRQSDITYSGVYNSSSNINKLNEFNLYLANFKDDIDKTYGPIIKLKGTDTNLEVYQEDKCSKVYYGKDVLYNADGSSNLTKIEAVLGQQEMYGGEYGISYHAESFDEYAFNSYLTDTKRGIVLKKSNNGLFEISSQGMNSYFKKLFRDNVINQIIGEYDQHHDVYVLNIKYNTNQYVTWVYSDKDNGWLGRITFNPEDMCRVNGKFLSFYEGEIYEHNQATGRNTFYGRTPDESKFVINFSQEPSMRKNYKTMEIEGTDAWDLDLLTDLDAGYVNALDFNKEEGVYKAPAKLSNTVVDTSLLSAQGIGNCTLNGLVLSFGFELDSAISIGDDVRNLSNLLVGTITNKTATTLTLNAVANLVSGDYVMCSKPQSANNNSLVGYHLQVSGTLTKNTKTELFAINSEVVKSFN